MFRIFDPIIREIDKLVAEQVTKVKMERLEQGNSASASVKVSQSFSLYRAVAKHGLWKHTDTCLVSRRYFW